MLSEGSDWYRSRTLHAFDHVHLARIGSGMTWNHLADLLRHQNKCRSANKVDGHGLLSRNVVTVIGAQALGEQ